MKRLISHIALLLCPFLLVAQNLQGKKFFSSDSTKVKEIFHYNADDSTLEGSYESFYFNGSLQTYGWFENNLPDSIWINYFENGRKRSMGSFDRGNQSGEWTYYYENGNIKSSGKLEKGIRFGKWTHYFESGKEKQTGEYDNDLKVGLWNYFYEDESLKAEIIYNEQGGFYREFYPFGSLKKEGMIVNDKSEGEWAYYYEEGALEAKGKFKNGLKTGAWEYFHNNGNTRAGGKYVLGKREGEWKHFHEDGSLGKAGDMLSNKKEGYWKLFYPSGELQGDISYDDGSGSFSEYYLSGAKKSEGKIVNGKKEGEWLYYDEDGNTEGRAIFENDHGMYEGYYPDGNLKIKGQMNGSKRVGQWTLFREDGSVAGTYTPIYEDEKPIFKTRESRDPSLESNIRYEKPEYKYKKRGIRYFDKRINEYRSAIIGSNPAWLLADQLPVALEYYMQERLGYELQVNIHRDPFFKTNENIPNYQVYERGAQIFFRQKFYHDNQKLGMFYFGHELGVKHIASSVVHPDTLIVPVQVKNGRVIENGISYGFFIGNRWMKNIGDSGITIDAFAGLRVEKRSFRRKFSPDPVIDVYFDSNNQKPDVHFPLIFGINVGFSLTDSKSKTL